MRTLPRILCLCLALLTIPPAAQAQRCEDSLKPLWRAGSFTDIAQATSLVQACLQRDPKDPEAHYLRAVIHMQNSAHEAALADLDAALTLRPDYIKALMNRAELRMVMGKPEEGLRDYDAAIRLAPDDARLRLRRANVLMNRQRFADAVRDYTDVIERLPDLAEAYNSRALAHAALHDQPAMCRDFSRLCDLGYCMNLERAVSRGDCRPAQ